MLKLRNLFVAATIALALDSSTDAHVFQYTAILSGAAEELPNNSPGVGTALVKLDEDELLMQVQVSFSGLLGNVTTADIHAVTATPLTGTAIVATPLPDFPLAGSSGAYDQTIELADASSYDPPFLTAHGPMLVDALNAFIFALDGRQAYLNIKTTAFPDGEIRGFLIHLPGDFNHNLVVDAADFIVWRDSFGQTGEGLAADTNNDNVIDDGDYAVWRQNFGRTGFDSGIGSSLASVPEPGPIALLMLGIGPFLARRPR